MVDLENTTHQLTQQHYYNMAELISYPTGTAAGDTLLVGTQINVPQPDGTTLNMTRNFTASSIAALDPTGISGKTAYIASFDQTSTDAPVVTEIFNNTGATFTWTRTNTGRYSITASSAVFTAGKTFYNIQGSGKSAAGQIIQPTTISTTVAQYRQVSNNSYSDGNRGWVEIRIY